MKVLIEFTFLLGISSVFGSPRKVMVENITVEYVDDKYINAKTGVYEHNGALAVNITVKINADVPDNLMMYATAFKWFVDDYRIQIFQIRKPLKDALEMESFDLQTAFLHYSRPPIVWPLQKGITYRLQGWIPDGSKFPPNIPDGRWKVRLIGRLPNNSPVAILNWFGSVG